MHRLSPTILNSFRYMLVMAGDDAADRIRTDLLNHLRGERGEPTEAMLAGQTFEADVMAFDPQAPINLTDTYALAVREAAGVVDGALCQQHVERELDGVMLHGYVDFMRAARIWDTKWSTSTPSIPKYQHSMQHRIYLYCCEPMQIGTFFYLICDGRNLYVEDYHWHPSYVDDLRSAMLEWFVYLDGDSEMREAFEARQEAAV